MALKPQFGSIMGAILLLLLTRCGDSATNSDTQSFQPEPDAEIPSRLIQMGITSPSNASRTFSFTNKKAAYYYGLCNGDTLEAWFAGWNINRKRVLQDYEIRVDGKPQRRGVCAGTVFPHEIRRDFPDIRETFWMIEGRDILVIELATPPFTGQSDDPKHASKPSKIGIQIIGDLASEIEPGWFQPVEAPEKLIHLIPLQSTPDSSVIYTRKGLKTPLESGGFALLFGDSRQQIQLMADSLRTHLQDWKQERQNRMQQLIESQFLPSHTPWKFPQDSLARDLAWLHLTLDALVMNQTGKGIYAGLPWFNDYWGRDQFISLPGACLVSGQFKTAREILRSFAQYQNTDSTSEYYGRLPNRLRPDDVLYNTTDATPRFISMVYAYWQYTGDAAFVREIFPAIRRAIAGAITHHVDASGFLTHGEAETWMDAKKDGKIPWSPRGNRAVDIQALWWQALSEASKMSIALMPQGSEAAYWQSLAEKCRKHFQQEFVQVGNAHLADHLNPDGSKDWALRPNQLFALQDSFLQNPALKTEIIANAWRQLVYSWGVSSLAASDPNFHPFHEHWHYYHKDAAYHNGTIWLWLNGIAIQRMLEQGQPEIAWQLFSRMNQQAAEQGAVGSLPENADAYPHGNAAKGLASGTFLQAWSNAEQLRVWYQGFWGISPEMPGLDGSGAQPVIHFRPAMPESAPAISQRLRFGEGYLLVKYAKSGGNEQFVLQSEQLAADLAIEISNFPSFKVSIDNGQTLTLNCGREILEYQLHGGKKQLLEDETLFPDTKKVAHQAKLDSIFSRVTFCMPGDTAGFRSLRNYHKIPLTF